MEGEGTQNKSPGCFAIQSSQRETVTDLSTQKKKSNIVVLHYFSFRTKLPTFFIYKYLSFDFSQYLQVVCSEENKLNVLKYRRTKKN